MTPQLEAAIAAIQPLTQTERQKLLQILIQGEQLANHHTELQTLSDQFWHGYTIPQLRNHQTPTPVHHLADLAADFWPEGDTEEFLMFLKQQRHSPGGLNFGESSVD